MNIKTYFILGSVLCHLQLLAQETRILMESQNGVYLVPCKVNGLNLKFIFDTGASKVTISLSEALFMLKNGYLNPNDIHGSSFAQLANGEITENTEVILKEIQISGLYIYNINALIIHELEAPLLLGQSALSKLGKISIDGSELLIYPNESLNTSHSGEPTLEDINLNYQRGKTALDLSDAQGSIQSFKFVIENSQDKDLIASSYGNLGIAYMLLNNSLESITMFQKACELNPLQYCHHTAFNKGVLFEQEGNFRKSIESFEEVIRLEPDNMTTKIITGYRNMNFEAHYRIGSIYSNEYEDCNQAIYHYNLSLEPFDEESYGKAEWKKDALNNITFCYYELGDWRKTITYANKILELNKYDKDALVALCFSYDNLGNTIEAKKYAKQASDLGDERGRLYLERD